MPRVVSFIVLLAVIILIGSMFFQVMVQFIVPLFLAAVLVVIFKPLHLWVVSRCEDKPRLAAAITTSLIVMIVLLPLGVIMARTIAEVAEQYYAFNEDHMAGAPTVLPNKEIASADLTQANIEATTDDSSPESAEIDNTANSANGDPATNQGDATNEVLEPADDSETNDDSTVNTDPETTVTPSVTMDKTTLLAATEVIVPKINVWLENIGMTALEPQKVSVYLRDQLEQIAGPIALGSFQVLVSTLFSLAIMVLTLYYFFADGPNMVVALMKLSPLDDEYEQELLDKFAAVSRSVVVAVLLSAIAQGVLAGIGYFFAGVSNVFLCTVITAIFAMVPFVGATVVWVPICLVLYFNFGYTTAAIVLAIYCTTVVSMVDNLIKPLVLHGQANLHPLLALLSVIGGIQVLGPIGILVGPMLVAFLQALLNMLNKELKLLGEESDATGKPVVFATSAASDEPSMPPPAALPKSSSDSKKHKRKRRK